MFDKTAIEIKDIYETKFLNPSKDASLNGQIAQYFIYYTGHGRMIGDKTMAIDQDYQDINIEQMIRDIAVRKNQTVISFLNCCRNEALSLGGGQSEPIKEKFYGRYLIVYAVQPGSQEIAY